MTVLKELLDVWLKILYIYTYISQSFSLFAEISMLYSLLSPDSEGVDFYRLDTV